MLQFMGSQRAGHNLASEQQSLEIQSAEMVYSKDGRDNVGELSFCC